MRSVPDLTTSAIEVPVFLTIPGLNMRLKNLYNYDVFHRLKRSGSVTWRLAVERTAVSTQYPQQTTVTDRRCSVDLETYETHIYK